MNWVKANWVILSALVAMGAAWGENKVKVMRLEDAVAKQVAIDAKVDVQAEKAAAIDERTKMMQRMLEEQQKLIIQVLSEVKK